MSVSLLTQQGDVELSSIIAKKKSAWGATGVLGSQQIRGAWNLDK